MALVLPAGALEGPLMALVSMEGLMLQPPRWAVVLEEVLEGVLEAPSVAGRRRRRHLWAWQQQRHCPTESPQGVLLSACLKHRSTNAEGPT